MQRNTDTGNAHNAYMKLYEDRVKEYEENPSRCLHCKLKIPYKKRNTNVFCSRSCSAKHNNPTSKRKYPLRFCKHCSKSLSSRSTNATCYGECRVEYSIREWLAGNIDGSSKYSYADYVKVYLVRRSGGVCEMTECNESRVKNDGSTILQVDHIDGDWRNNSKENLRLICPNCHSLTENFGSRNKGNGRAWKKKYDQFNLRA